MVWQRRLVAPLRRRSFPSTRHQLNLGLVQYFNIFCHKKIRQFFWPHHMEYFFSKILKSWICPWFEEWSYFPWIFRFICYKLYLHFVETKNLRVDSSGDLDFPQLENSLQVKPFLLPPISLISRGGTRLPSECDYLPKYSSLWRLSIDNRHKREHSAVDCAAKCHL